MRATRRLLRVSSLAGAIGTSLLLSGCGGSSGGSGPEGPPGPVFPPGVIEVGEYEQLPGVNVVVTGVTGGTGPGGNVLAGDTLTVHFTVKDDAGVELDLTAMDSGQIYVSGPSFNYQRVLPAQSDVRSAAVYAGAGAWTYTFASPLPAVYAAPYNDTESFGPDDGELTGEPLLDGTYTIGLQLYRNVAAGGVSYRDSGTATFDFLLGSATSIDPREAVANANCNACHTELRAHGGSRKDVRLCVLCHTAGAEDKNDATTPGHWTTEGVSIDFRVMVHKIHAGAHLPSVVGVSVNPDGSKNFAATPSPLEYVGYKSMTQDFSSVAFPVWPSLNISMPRDLGYSALSSTDPDGSGPLLSPKSREDAILRGPVSCTKCHGDPDGTGPEAAPEQGDLYTTQPSKQACGACHDDIDWHLPYTSNGSTMPPQPVNGACSVCHTPTGGSLPVKESHVHPLLNPAVDPGLHFNVSSVTDAAGGPVDVGDKVKVQFTITDDAGAAVSPSALTSVTTVVSGPTWNPNMMLYNLSLPNTHPAFDSGPPYTLFLPQNVALEWVGTSTASATDGFSTLLAPHVNRTGSGTNTTNGLTAVRIRATGGDGSSATTTAASSVFQTWFDVVSIPAGYAANDYLVVEDGTSEKEFVQIRLLDAARGRIWLLAATPCRKAHPVGATLTEVTLTSKTVATHWTLDAATGAITEVGGNLGTANDVLCSYMTDWVVPSVYPQPNNDSPDLGEEVVEWKGKPLLAGTYTLDLYGYVNRVLNLWGETQTYRGTSPGVWSYFRVGTAAPVEPYDFTAGAATCNSCHDDIRFHGGGRRGFETCIMCHGTADLEDNPSSASPQPEVLTASFRTMLHKIHMAEELPDAATYPWEAETGFPAMPGGVAQCVKCHGNEAWKQPSDRTYPGSLTRARTWTAVCGSCHSSDAAYAHIDINTPLGVEGCAVCHGPGAAVDVVKVHFPR